MLYVSKGAAGQGSEPREGGYGWRLWW